MEDIMTKVFGALAIAATLAVATVALPKQAEAKCFGCGIGAGFVAGALLGNAVANTGPGYGYGYAPVYTSGACFWRKETFFDGFAWRIRRVPVCY
jgi:hypothetical protein